MSCLLCFNYNNEDDNFSVHDFSEATKMTATELIYKHFDFAEAILTEDNLASPDTCLCKNCFVNLENFNDFYTYVAANYTNINQPKENKYMVAPETNSTNLVVYEEQEVDNEMIDLEMVKMEPLIDSAIFETEWIEEKKEPEKKPSEPSPKKVKRIKTMSLPKTPRQSTTAVLDSADDQRIRETAKMFCEMCHEPLDSLREAKSHYRNKHSVKGYIVCCERKFKERRRLLEHVNSIHFNRVFTCDVCAKTFGCKSYLVLHQACHDDLKLFECAHCPKKFSRKFKVRNHLLSVHIFDNVEPNLECPVHLCGKKFVNQARLKLHIDKTHSNNNLQICEICSKQFRTKNAIDEHMKSHTRKAEDRIRCEICGHYLADIKSYNRHVKNHGTEQLDNTCSYCGKKSPNSNALKLHIRYVHEKSKTFACKFCEKSFKRPRDLIDHEAAVHTLQDLYACTFCSKTFRNQSNMLAHRKRQHPDQYQKPKYMRDSL